MLGYWLMSSGQDMRLALRNLRTRPGFALVTILILALGVGANTSVFSIAHGVLLSPLPYPQSGELVQLWPSTWINKRAFVEVESSARSYTAVAAFSTLALPLTGEGEPEVVVSARVTPGFFETLGVAPTLGRAFAAEESAPGRHLVAVLGHGLWQTRYGSRQDILGRRITLDGEAYEVIGVMGPEHRPLDSDWQLWTPLPLDPTDEVDLDSSFYLQMVGRLRGGSAEGAVLDDAEAELGRLAQGLMARNPQRFTAERVEAAKIISLHEAKVGDTRSTLLLLLASVGAILLVACANLANLFLARSASRRQELAVRAALGAGRWRLFRQLMMESLVLASFGGLGGLLLSLWVFDFLSAQLPAEMPRSGEISIDAPVLGFAALVTLVSAFLFGCFPAFRSATTNLISEMSSGRRLADRGRLSSALVVAQVGASLALLVVAILLTRSLMELRSVDPGFRVEQTVALRPVPSKTRYEDYGSVMRYYQEVSERLLSVPGVREVGGIHLLPLTQGNWSFPYGYEGQELPTDPSAGTSLPTANFRIVTAEYFQAAGMPLEAGRAFSSADGRSATGSDAPPWEAKEEGSGPQAEPYRVGIINRTLADRLWPDDNAVGRRIDLFGNMPFEVVGVVADIHQHGLAEGSRPEIYWPLAQSAMFEARSLVMMVRAEGPIRKLGNTLRQAVWSVDPDVPISELYILGDLLESNVASPKLRAHLLSFFAVLALLSSAMGVYGLVSFSVAQRYREIGIRMALGARGEAIVGQVLLGGLRLTAWGWVFGIGLAIGATALLEEHLFAIPRGHLPTWIGASVFVLAVVVVACWWPARRASAIDPATILRQD